jgi:hypothetical protein
MEYHKDHEILNFLVEVLHHSGVQKKEIASQIKIPKLDLSDLAKLCSGTSKTCNGLAASDYISVDIDTINNDRIFFLYYWSIHHQLKFSIIAVNDVSKSGEFVYVKKGTNSMFEIERKSKVDSFNHNNLPTIEFILKKEDVDVSTFITAHKGSKKLNDIRLTYCAYCGATGSNYLSYSGIGILEQIPKMDLLKHLVYLAIEGVPPSISNALYRRRFDLETSESEVYDSYEQIKEKQINAIKNLVGYWVGYYPRKNIEVGKVRGGIAKVVMSVKADGKVHVYYQAKSHPDYSPDYEGILRFPHSKKKSIIVGELEHYKKTHRVRFLLNAHSNQISGNFSGWRDEDSFHFSRAIFFEKVENIDLSDHKNDIPLLLSLYKPRGYHRGELEGMSKIIEKLIKIEADTIHTMKSCVGDINTSMQMNLFDQSDIE